MLAGIEGAWPPLGVSRSSGRVFGELGCAFPLLGFWRHLFWVWLTCFIIPFRFIFLSSPIEIFYLLIIINNLVGHLKIVTGFVSPLEIYLSNKKDWNWVFLSCGRRCLNLLILNFIFCYNSYISGNHLKSMNIRLQLSMDWSNPAIPGYWSRLWRFFSCFLRR